MKKLLTLLTSILLVSCNDWKEAREGRETFIDSLEVGDQWDNYPQYDCRLKESNTEYSKYFIEGFKGYYYITVKDKHIVSIWVKPKPY